MQHAHFFDQIECLDGRENLRVGELVLGGIMIELITQFDQVFNMVTNNDIETNISGTNIDSYTLSDLQNSQNPDDVALYNDVQAAFEGAGVILDGDADSVNGPANTEHAAAASRGSAIGV